MKILKWIILVCALICLISSPFRFFYAVQGSVSWMNFTGGLFDVAIGIALLYVYFKLPSIPIGMPAQPQQEDTEPPLFTLRIFKGEANYNTLHEIAEMIENGYHTGVGSPPGVNWTINPSDDWWRING